MSKIRSIRTRCGTITLSTALALLLLCSATYGDDSSCIVCHTDIDLLEENLGEGGKKKSALQAGSG